MLDAKKGIIPIDFSAVRQKVNDGGYSPALTEELAISVAEKLKIMISDQKRDERFQASIHKQKIYHERNTIHEAGNGRRSRACSSTMPAVRPMRQKSFTTPRLLASPQRISTQTRSSKASHSSQSEHEIVLNYSDSSPIRSSRSPQRATVIEKHRSESFPSSVRKTSDVTPRNSTESRSTRVLFGSRSTTQLKDYERGRLSSGGTHTTSNRAAEPMPSTPSRSESEHWRRFKRTTSNLEAVEEEMIRKEIRKMEQVLQLNKKKLKLIEKQNSQISSGESDLHEDRVSRSSSCSFSDVQCERAGSRHGKSVARPHRRHKASKSHSVSRRLTTKPTDLTDSTVTSSRVHDPRDTSSSRRIRPRQEATREGARMSRLGRSRLASDRPRRRTRRMTNCTSGDDSDFSAGRLSDEADSLAPTLRPTSHGARRHGHGHHHHHHHHHHRHSDDSDSSSASSGNESEAPLSSIGIDSPRGFETPRKHARGERNMDINDEDHGRDMDMDIINEDHHGRDRDVMERAEMEEILPDKPIEEMTQVERTRYERRLRKQRCKKAVRHNSPRRKICQLQSSAPITPPTRARFNNSNNVVPNEGKHQEVRYDGRSSPQLHRQNRDPRSMSSRTLEIAAKSPLRNSRSDFYSNAHSRMSHMSSRSSLKAPINAVQYFNIASPRRLLEDEDTISYASMENTYECNYADFAYPSGGESPMRSPTVRGYDGRRSRSNTANSINLGGPPLVPTLPLKSFSHRHKRLGSGSLLVSPGLQCTPRSSITRTPRPHNTPRTARNSVMSHGPPPFYRERTPHASGSSHSLTLPVPTLYHQNQYLYQNQNQNQNQNQWGHANASSPRSRASMDIYDHHDDYWLRIAPSPTPPSTARSMNGGGVCGSSMDYYNDHYASGSPVAFYCDDPLFLGDMRDDPIMEQQTPPDSPATACAEEEKCEMENNNHSNDNHSDSNSNSMLHAPREDGTSKNGDVRRDEWLYMSQQEMVGMSEMNGSQRGENKEKEGKEEGKEEGNQSISLLPHYNQEAFQGRNATTTQLIESSCPFNNNNDSTEMRAEPLSRIEDALKVKEEHQTTSGQDVDIESFLMQAERNRERNRGRDEDFGISDEPPFTCLRDVSGWKLDLAMGQACDYKDRPSGHMSDDNERPDRLNMMCPLPRSLSTEVDMSDQKGSRMGIGISIASRSTATMDFRSSARSTEFSGLGSTYGGSPTHRHTKFAVDTVVDESF